MDDLIGHSITCRVAVGSRAGQKVLALQTVPASEEGEHRAGVVHYVGLSLHAATALEGEERETLERLARYVTRPAVAGEALSAHVAMRWAQRPKPMFAIEIERCVSCGGRIEVIASIEAPALIERILEHLRQRADQAPRP
jgi:hypothetical protein